MCVSGKHLHVMGSVKGGEMVCWLDGGENKCGVEGVGGDGKSLSENKVEGSHVMGMIAH